MDVLNLNFELGEVSRAARVDIDCKRQQGEQFQRGKICWPIERKSLLYSVKSPETFFFCKKGCKWKFPYTQQL